MQVLGIGSADEWAEQTFAGLQLGHQSRNRRARVMARGMARNPAGSVPQQMGSEAATKAAYRFLESAHSSYEQLIAAPIEQTQALLRQQQQRLLLLQDTTEVEYTDHRAVEGLGPVGKGKHQRGYLLQSVLAVDPTSTQVLGLAAQEAFLRQPAPAGEKTHERRKREHKESQVWQRQVEAIGAVPQGCEYVHVGDRASDIFSFLRTCQRLGGGFVVRMQHDRRVDGQVERGEEPVAAGALRWGQQRSTQQEPVRHLREEVERWPAAGTRTLVLDGNQNRQQREATLRISWGQVRLWPPEGEGRHGETPLVVSVIRTWEPDPPEGVEALEWILLCSVPVQEEAQAWEQVGWYGMRWIMEDYHQCLKTGCQLEARQLQSYEGLRTLLGFLAPLAVRLLQLRAAARQEPERLAQEVLPRDLVAVVAQLAHVKPEQLRVRQCFRRIAQLGGYLGRKADGDPGWKTLWKGWLQLQAILEGVHLASQLSLD